MLVKQERGKVIYSLRSGYNSSIQSGHIPWLMSDSEWSRRYSSTWFQFPSSSLIFLQLAQMGSKWLKTFTSSWELESSALNCFLSSSVFLQISKRMLVTQRAAMARNLFKTATQKFPVGENKKPRIISIVLITATIWVNRFWGDQIERATNAIYGVPLATPRGTNKSK